MTEAITFKRDRTIHRGNIRVGWIERRGRDTWLVRFTPASGRPGVLGCFERLGDAKQAALSALYVMEPAS